MSGLTPITETAPAAIAPATPPPPEPKAPEPAAPPAPEPPKLAVTAPAEPAKPAAEDDESKWPRSAKDWDAFKAKRKERETALSKERDDIKAERDRLNEEITTLKGQGPSPELETLKKERDEYEQQLRLHAVENHPKFKAYFDGKTNAQIELAKRIVGTDNADAISKALALPEGDYRDAKIQEVFDTLSPLQQSRLGSVTNALSEIQAERQTEVARSRENFEKMQTEQKTAQERTAAESNKAAQDAVNDALAKAQDPKTGLFLFQKQEGNEAWNKEVDSRIAGFKHLATGPATREQRIQACRDAAAFPAVLRYAQERDAEIAKLTAQVKSLSAVQPSPGGKGNATPENNGTPVPIKINSGSRPMEASKAWIANIQGEWLR